LGAPGRAVVAVVRAAEAAVVERDVPGAPRGVALAALLDCTRGVVCVVALASDGCAALRGVDLLDSAAA